jgi:hypothetical protein
MERQVASGVAFVWATRRSLLKGTGSGAAAWCGPRLCDTTS